MKIALACDHGAFELKNVLVKKLSVLEGLTVVDMGIFEPISVDYPDLAKKLCQAILAQEVDRGILLCGTGLGMSMAANRFAGIRAALCHDGFTARLSRQHNDANVLVLGGRTTGVAVAEEIVSIWLTESFQAGRHQRRIEKLELER
ncbi:MAG: ribose 5-phosphate isomerase B [Magnetococcus sp. DMHC-6]